MNLWALSILALSWAPEVVCSNTTATPDNSTTVVTSATETTTEKPCVLVCRPFYHVSYLSFVVSVDDGGDSNRCACEEDLGDADWRISGASRVDSMGRPAVVLFLSLMTFVFR